jgi:hypothetical protein
LVLRVYDVAIAIAEVFAAAAGRPAAGGGPTADLDLDGKEFSSRQIDESISIADFFPPN